MLLITLLVGFVIGALTIIAVEAVGVFLLLARLNRRVNEEDAKAKSQSARGVSDLTNSSLPSPYCNKQGVVWILEPGKVPREQKRKKDIFEVAPIRKNAKVKDNSLILTESDGSRTEIQLKGCNIAAVSATSLPSRKWAKKYPIKVESKTSVLYNGSKIFYIYLETSWEKESWCKALRLAACVDREKLKWFSKLNLEFQSYLTNLNTGYPSFMKPSVGINAESVDRSVNRDGSSSKVRHFLKKLAKKASKSGVENKASWTSTSGREERKIFEKSHSFKDSVLGIGVVRTASIGDTPNLSAEDKIGPSLSTLSYPGSRSHNSVVSDADSDDRIGSDEGTLCWNLLTSRLFFDAQNNTMVKNSVQARIQRTLSNMRIPSYIGEITCIGLDLGSLPPHISGMRVLPSDMNEIWALEIDVQYSGGALLNIETRLEVRELDFEGGIVDTNLEPSHVEEVTSDLLEGLEYFGKQLELSDVADGSTEPKDEAYSKLVGMKSNKTANATSSYASRWKSILNRVAKQVSQVPLSLAIRVASLKGTLRLHIKPPPSDQLWFGFTSMPDIDFNLESSVGEHKISSGHIALFLISRFKTAIRETLVLPNCENVCIPWMLAEKDDDWLPRKDAPFIWVNQEAPIIDPDPSPSPSPASAPVRETPTLTTNANRKTTSDFPEVVGHEKARKVENFQRQISESSSGSSHASSLDPTIQSTWRSKSLQELNSTLLSNDDEQQEAATCESSRKEENHPEYESSPSEALVLNGELIQVMEGGDDPWPKRIGTTKARMLGLRKKVGEKLEEKRRHIEEKGRHIVERMRDRDGGPKN